MKANPCADSRIGIAVAGFDARNPADVAEVGRLLYAHKIVILKDQSLDEQGFCELSHLFGTPVPYLQSNYHHPDFPLIFVSSNMTKNGQKMGVARTGGYWHSDTSFMAQPIPLTLLYPQVIPKNSRRTTLFIDMEQALAEMPPSLRRRVESARFIHSGKWKYKVRREDAGLDLSEILQMIHKVQPPVVHPAVLTHPVTGRRMLYASRGFTIGVDGLGEDAGSALLKEVFDFVEHPRFISEFQWQMGDIILWDNRFLAHKAGRLAQANDPVDGDVATEEDTLVYRIIIQDGHPLSADAGAHVLGSTQLEAA
jgi:taurine dioxygenase